MRPEDYPIAGGPATDSLAGELRDRIRGTGSLRFPEFMQAALYHPDFGYYARGHRQVGRGGDFFTSVSVGPVFGGILARRFLRFWKDSGAPPHWRITECGAHDGRLARDVIEAMFAIHPDAAVGLEYTICEPLASLRAAQRNTLDGFAQSFRIVESPEILEEDPLPGVVFGNELLDALPFHIVEWDGEMWNELAVGLGPEGGFTWQPLRVEDPRLARALEGIGHEFPPGYRTEIRPRYDEFLAPLARQFGANPGLMLWLDYGFLRDEYYHPHRTAGTLRTFSRHRAAEDPLACPGSCDITAHVDFTAVAEACQSLGGWLSPLRRQGPWLTENAREWLLEWEGQADMRFLRQFQTLTHPGHLGTAFQVLEAEWR